MAAGLAGAALLLAFLFHVGVAAVAAAILATVPTGYLTWKALSTTAKKTPRGRPAQQWDPVELGVHPVIGGGPMPPYVRRPHDELLRAVLDPAVAASRLVVLRGGSSTGKTRAAYEAVAARLADWQVDYPLNAAALAARLDTGIPARTVLWLGELRQYADDRGGAAVLGRLADLLKGTGHVLITTVWPEHWTTYTAAARAGTEAADPAGVAGRLLTSLPELANNDPARVDPGRGGVIDVPPRFTPADLEAATRTGDRMLADAAAAAARAEQEGQVTQYLAGVPDLLDRYAGPGGNPYGQAIITAAMDATRLGHASPLPAAFLQQAAVGYLTGPQRTEDIASWRDTALAWAAEELNGAVRAVQPVPPLSGTGVAGYQVADYLDQHGRRHRHALIPPPSFWAAARCAQTADLTTLAAVGRARGLYRDAARLLKDAAARGDPRAGANLIDILHDLHPGDHRAAEWVTVDVPLDLRDPYGTAVLLRELRAAGAQEQVTALLARDPAAHVALDAPYGVSILLDGLRAAGAQEQVTALADRAAALVPLDNPYGVVSLLRGLQEAGAQEQVTALADRAAGLASLGDPFDIARLLEVLREAGAQEQVTALLARDPAAHVALDDPWGVAGLLRELRAAGMQEQVTALLARDPATHVALDNPSGAAVDNPSGVAGLLRELREAGAEEQVTALADRAAAALDNPWGVAGLLRELRAAGMQEQVTALLARDPAAHVALDNPWGVTGLLRELREAGAEEQVTALADRAAGLAPSATRPASPACCWTGCWRRARRSRSPRCWPGIRPRTSPSTTRTASPSCWTGCWRRARRSRSPRCWPGIRPRTSPSTTRPAPPGWRTASPDCWAPCGRRARRTRSRFWSIACPAKGCSICSARKETIRRCTGSAGTPMGAQPSHGDGKI